MARKPRKAKLLKCKVLNAPETKEQKERYGEKVYEALATALYRSLEPGNLNNLINQLKEV